MKRRSLLSGLRFLLTGVLAGCVDRTSDATDDEDGYVLVISNQQDDRHEYEITVYDTDGEPIYSKRHDLDAGEGVDREPLVNDPASRIRIDVDGTIRKTIDDPRSCDPDLSETVPGELIVEHEGPELRAYIDCY